MTIAADNEPKGAGARGLAGRALGWWIGELRALQADLMGRFASGRRNALVIEAGERYWILRHRERPLGQIDRSAPDADETGAVLRRLVPRGAAIMVEIPSERALTKRIALPEMAQAELERVLRFEIARHFPFPAERVHFRHRIIARRAGSIELDIVAVPREIVAEICGALAAAGLRPGRVAVAGRSGDAPLVLPGAVPEALGAALGPAQRALLLALALLAAAALASPLVHDRVRLAALEREIAELKPRAQAMLDARERQRRAAQRTAGPLHLEAARPPLVVLLDALTQAVPDGSWLVSLSLSGRELVIDGLSPSAATTVLALEKSPIFANVVFRSPIVRDPQTGLERFQLSAAIAEPAP